MSLMTKSPQIPGPLLQGAARRNDSTKDAASKKKKHEASGHEVIVSIVMVMNF